MAALHEQAQELVDAFEFLEDWEQRYRFIMDMGKKLEPLRPEEKIEPHRVYGCQSTVYLVRDRDVNDATRICFRAESDAAIVNGLIAILRKVYDGRSAEEVRSFPIEDFLRQLGLDEHLSPTRRNGLHEMVKRVRGFAIGELATDEHR